MGIKSPFRHNVLGGLSALALSGILGTSRLTMRKRIVALTTAFTLLSATSVVGLGWWDSAFDSDGFASVSFTNYTDTAYGFAIQSDGKIVAVGESYTGDGTPGNPSNQEQAIARFEANGSPDVSFGTGGKVRPTWSTSNEYLSDVAQQSDGKIVAVGNTSISAVGRFSVVRLNSDGTLDSTFDSDGLATLGTDTSIARALVIQPDQKIVVAGQMFAVVAGQNIYDLVLARFNSDGSLDNTFGSGGYVRTSLGSTVVPTSLQLQSDGKFLISAYGGPSSNYDSYIFRYTSGGSLDTSFSGDGIEILPLNSTADLARDITVQPDGKILVTGSTDVGSYRDSFVIRLTSTGVVDNTFGTNGVVVHALSDRNDSPQGIALQTDGKIVLGGGLNIVNTGNGFIARLLADGSLDPTFGCGGFETRVEGGSTSFNAVSVLSGGQIVAAGYANVPSGTGRNFAVAQFDPSIARPTACSASSTTTSSTSTSTSSTTSTTTPPSTTSTTSTTVDSATSRTTTTTTTAPVPCPDEAPPPVVGRLSVTCPNVVTPATAPSTSTTVKSATTSTLATKGIAAATTSTSASTSTTTTTTTSTIPSTTTTQPPRVGPGDTEVPPGDVVVTIGGVPVKVTVDDSSGSLVTKVEGGTVTHEIITATGEKKNLSLAIPTSWDAGDTVRISFDGFAPDSFGTVWVYPEGMTVGDVPLSDGSGSVDVKRPVDMSGDNRRLVATARSRGGADIAITYGVAVPEDSSAAGWSRVLLLIVGLAVVAGLLIPAARRRRSGNRPVLMGVDDNVDFIGIYNADGSLLGEISYVLAKYTGRGHCELCDITHGTFRRKRSWNTVCDNAGIDIALVHRDEATADQLHVAGDLPAVIRKDGNGWHLVAGPSELAACDGDPERLMSLLTTSSR